MQLKLIVSILVIMSTQINFAQDVNYGFVLGATDYTTQNLVLSSGFNGTGSKHLTPVIGGFLEAPFSKSFGVQAIFGFNKVSELLNFPDNNTNSHFPVTSNLRTIQSSIHAKYDLDNNYGKGGYLLFGPRLTYIMKAEDDSSGANAEYIYKEVRLGIQIGYGFNFLKHFNFMLIGDYGFTNIIDLKGLKSKTIGGHGLVSINLNSIFSGS